MFLIEGDMLVPAGVRQRLMQDHLPRMLSQPDGIATAWAVPLFEHSEHVQQAAHDTRGVAKPTLRASSSAGGMEATKGKADTNITEEYDPIARHVVQTKAELLADPTWEPCKLQSHEYMRLQLPACSGRNGECRPFMQLWRAATAPLPIALSWSQEPYYVVNRRSTVRYVGEGGREVNVQRQNEPGALLFVFVLTVVCVLICAFKAGLNVVCVYRAG